MDLLCQGARDSVVHGRGAGQFLFNSTDPGECYALL